MADYKSGQDPFASGDIPAGQDPFAQSAPPQTMEQLLGPSDFTKAFASTPARMLKSGMQMVGAGDYVPEAVSRAAAQGDTSAVGRIVGDVAGTGGIRGGAGALVNAVQRLNAAKGFLPAVGRTAEAAGYGAAQGAITSPDNQAEAAGWGAAGGALGQTLGRVAGGIVRPTAEAKQLMDAGVALTPGQAAGIGSLPARIEQSLASNPLSSVPIRAAQRRAVEEANVAAAQSVVRMVDDSVKLGKPPREAIEQTREAIGKHYDDALQGLKADPLTIRNGLEHSYDTIIDGNPLLSDKAFSQMRQYVDSRLTGIANKGFLLDGPGLKQIDSEIGGHIRRLKSSTNAEDKVAAGAWMDLQQSLRETMASLSGPEQAAKLNAANGAYRQLLALEKALPAGADTFTPRQLRRSLERAQIAGQPINTIANAMDKTLPNVVNDSGTAERLITNALPALLVGGGAGASSLGYDTLGSGMMAAGALGTKTGARTMTGSLPGQQMLANALRRVTPAATREAGRD